MKISSKVLLFTTVTALALAMTCMGLGQDSRPLFSISISAPQSVSTGSVAKLDIIVKNISKEPIVFGTDDVTRGELNFAFDVRGPDGLRASETPYMKAGQLTRHLGYADLKPGETLQESADLSKLFDLTPGTYTIQLWRFENDYVIASTGGPGDSDLKKPVGTQPTQS